MTTIIKPKGLTTEYHTDNTLKDTVHTMQKGAETVLNHLNRGSNRRPAEMGDQSRSPHPVLPVIQEEGDVQEEEEVDDEMQDGYGIDVFEDENTGSYTIAAVQYTGPRGALLQMVEAEIGGQPIRMCLDGGAAYSVIPVHLVQELGLPLSKTVMTVEGVGGVERLTFTEPVECRIGSLQFQELCRNFFWKLLVRDPPSIIF